MTTDVNYQKCVVDLLSLKCDSLNILLMMKGELCEGNNVNH